MSPEIQREYQSMMAERDAAIEALHQLQKLWCEKQNIMTIETYLASKERELSAYEKEVAFQSEQGGDDARTLWLMATQRVAFLKQEIAAITGSTTAKPLSPA